MDFFLNQRVKKWVGLILDKIWQDALKNYHYIDNHHHGLNTLKETVYYDAVLH